MKAIRYRRYGSPDALEFAEADLPAVGDRDVLVRVRAASLSPLDRYFMRGQPYIMRAQAGLSRPKTHVLGADMAGQVEAVEPDDDLLPGPPERGGPVRPARLPPGREGHPGHRPDLPAERGGQAMRYLEQGHARGKIVITV
jgi:threonine dehydrogenase-like Zn-dependent dehydrogenase